MILEQYPDFWRQSPETVAILEALGGEAAALRGDLRDLLAQCNVETATWGLALWERQVDLPTDPGLPDALRRSKILAKLRGVGTVTPEMLRAVAESYADVPVELEEQPRAYHFILRYIGAAEIAHRDDLIRSIDELKPAHLTFDVRHRVYQLQSLYIAPIPRQGERMYTAPLYCGAPETE